MKQSTTGRSTPTRLSSAHALKPMESCTVSSHTPSGCEETTLLADHSVTTAESLDAVPVQNSVVTCASATSKLKRLITKSTGETCSAIWQTFAKMMTVTMLSYVRMLGSAPSNQLNKKEKKPKKKSNIQAFTEMVQSLEIVNGKHYDYFLSINPDLRELELLIPPSTLETKKKTIFRQNYLAQPNLAYPSHFPDVSWAQMGAMNFYLRKIADQNSMSCDSLKQRLSDWLFNVNPKKKGLILYGTTDAGKSFFANLLTGCIKPEYIGHFNCPLSNNVSSFFLQACINTYIYRCDEFCFKQEGVVQCMKQLLEGSNCLNSDVKYRDATKIEPKPTVMTMNGDSLADIFKWFPLEEENFHTRCLILSFHTKLTSIFPRSELGLIENCHNALYNILLEKKKTFVKSDINLLDKYIVYNYIFCFLLGGSSISITSPSTIFLNIIGTCGI